MQEGHSLRGSQARRPRKRACATLMTAVVALLASVGLFGTGQTGDVLRWKGKAYSLFSNPLERYLDTHPDVRPRGDVISTANWRGYVATWEVREQKLFLTNVEVEIARKDGAKDRLETERRSVLESLFPGQHTVLAEWYTGHLIVPDGKLIRYVHMGYASLYKKYIAFRVERGTVVRQWTLDAASYSTFRAQQFARYKQTEAYRASVKDLQKEGDTLERIDAFLFDVAVEEYMSRIFDDKIRALPSKRMHPTAGTR